MKDNKLIAGFMRWDILSPTTIPPNLHLSNLEVDNGHISNLKFHSSRDWLMPEVDKCFDRLMEDDGWDDLNFILNDALLTTNIDEVYKVVIKIIKQIK